MPSLFDSLYRFNTKDTLTAPGLNTRFQSLDSRVAPLEALQVTWQAAVSIVQDKVLQETTAVIQSLHDQIANLTSLNWLVSVSSTPLNLTPEASLQLLVAPSDAALFAPGPFSILSRIGDVNFYAVVETTSYDRNTGTYAFEVLTVNGTPGTYTDWQIAAVAGSTLAQMTMLNQVTAALATCNTDAAAAHTDRLQADADAAATAADRAAINSKLTVSSSSPSGGNDGDIWFKI